MIQFYEVNILNTYKSAVQFCLQFPLLPDVVTSVGDSAVVVMAVVEVSVVVVSVVFIATSVVSVPAVVV
jgi:hypothetical protein